MQREFIFTFVLSPFDTAVAVSQLTQKQTVIFPSCGGSCSRAGGAFYHSLQTFSAMNFYDKHTLLSRLHAFIDLKATGTADACARRLQISRATFYRCLDDLRDFGAEIDYCTMTQSYYYREDFNFLS